MRRRGSHPPPPDGCSRRARPAGRPPSAAAVAPPPRPPAAAARQASDRPACPRGQHPSARSRSASVALRGCTRCKPAQHLPRQPRHPPPSRQAAIGQPRVDQHRRNPARPAGREQVRPQLALDEACHIGSPVIEEPRRPSRHIERREPVQHASGQLRAQPLPQQRRRRHGAGGHQYRSARPRPAPAAPAGSTSSRRPRRRAATPAAPPAAAWRRRPGARRSRPQHLLAARRAQPQQQAQPRRRGGRRRRPGDAQRVQAAHSRSACSAAAVSAAPIVGTASCQPSRPTAIGRQADHHAAAERLRHHHAVPGPQHPTARGLRRAGQHRRAGQRGELRHPGCGDPTRAARDRQALWRYGRRPRAG